MTQKIQTLLFSPEIHTREIVKLYLEEFGVYNLLSTVSDFEKAFLALKELDKSLMIIDISQSEDNSFDFMEKVSKEIPNCKIMVISDKPSVDLVIKAMRSGAREFVSLPLIKNDLFTSLSKICDELNKGSKKISNKCKILSEIGRAHV